MKVSNITLSWYYYFNFCFRTRKIKLFLDENFFRILLYIDEGLFSRFVRHVLSDYVSPS